MKIDSLASKAFTEIRKKILSKQLTENTRLKEDEWAKKIGVSRMAVREALTRLLGEGLVILGEKGGYYVKPILASEVRDIRELREVMELGAIRLAGKKMDTEQFAVLEKICDDFTDMVQKGYYNGALEADMKFHETLVEFAENKKLLQVYRSSHIPLFHQKLANSQMGTDDYDLTNAEHRQIVKALKDKNLKLAEQTLIQHFSRGEKVILEIV
ncbi:GntR family transcriptional regulator [Segetibacter aerophilus]|uniref:GntR family transcriptional regulator n=1 Tax=Segetibacter aerophilus TaxID=670293 RepID=A0A512BIV2_9BACT|nr:GntR family transcriptional regulator [Segetibacter aerophilus]GEO11883.1 GntR family transcriptional regulator [Segetibacter aerophilus]